MAELDPLLTSSHIRDTYFRYLRTTFALQDPLLRNAYHAALEGMSTQLVKGPLIEASPPYQIGSSIEELIAEGVLHPGMRRLASDVLPLLRPLYKHQDEAVRHVVGTGRNAVIATGTGSGKTESFLLPILDHLVREHVAGTLGEPGVRALLLYPMNALANDQLKRLCHLLAGAPEITFGRYTGETKEQRRQAEEHFLQQSPYEPLLANHLLSREEMRERPPHILLTNYAMLEYLLMRPVDTAFFDGETGDHWRFIVLDEAHVYRGATGIEIGMLIRRLKDRVVRSERGRLRCVATSATLGRGALDFPLAANFASALFDEPFEQDQLDPSRQDVIQAQVVPAGVDHETWGDMPSGGYGRLAAAGDDVAALLSIAQECGVAPEVLARAHSVSEGPDGASAVLHAVLQGDGHLQRLRLKLSEQPAFLADLSRTLFPDEQAPEAALVQLAALAVRARPDTDSAPLLPARYHLFARSLEGAFVCLRDHDGGPALYLERRRDCPRCAAMDRRGRVFELAACSRCGRAYLVGALEADEENSDLFRLAPPSADPYPTDQVHNRQLKYAMLGVDGGADDEDELTDTDDDLIPGDQLDHRRICSCCGALFMPGERTSACGCPDSPDRIRDVILDDARPGRSSPRSCLGCGARAGTGEVIYRFLLGQDAPPSVL